jgi:signal transduction histidine kinase
MRYVVFISFLLLFTTCSNPKKTEGPSPQVLLKVDSLIGVNRRNSLEHSLVRRNLDLALKLIGTAGDSLTKEYKYKILWNSFFCLENKNQKYRADFEKYCKMYPNDSVLIGRLYLAKGRHFVDKDLSDKAFVYFNYAEKVFSKIKYLEGMCETYLRISELLMYLNDYSISEHYLMKAEKILKKFKNEGLYKKLILIKAHILNTHYKYGASKTLLENALKYGVNNMVFEKKHRADLREALMLSYSFNKMYKESHQLMNELKKDEYKGDLIYELIVDVENKINLYKNFDAISEYEYYLKKCSESKNLQFLICREYTNYLLSIKSFDKARQMANRAYRLCKNGLSPYDYLNSLVLLSRADPSQRLLAITEYDRVIDEILVKKRYQQNNFYKIQLETNQLALAKVKTERQRNQLLWGLGGASLLSLIIFLSYRNRLFQLRHEINKKNQKSNARIEELLVKNQEIEAQTRKHLLRGIAMEIHDNVLNRLASTRYQLFKLHFKQDKQTLSEAIEGIDHIQQVENELRLLTHDLTQESNSATISLLSMIQELIDIHHEVYDQEVEFTVSQWDWEQLLYDTKVNCLRIVQEALLNITKHAKATRISIQFIHESHQLIFRISDNGKGIEAVKTGLGIGLKNLEERAQMMAATIDVYSTPAEGTTLQITLPI